MLTSRETILAALHARLSVLPATALCGEVFALGSGLIELQSQNKTVTASAIAERKTLGHLSYRVATRR